jgi:hypothetical protein
MSANNAKTRPELLTWLCTGSASFGILWIVMFLVMITYSIKGDVPPGLFPRLVIEYLHAGYIFIALEIFLTVLGIIAVILMWQLKKTGFYLYATIKAMVYFLPVVLIGTNHLTYPGLIITSVLIIMYGILIEGVPNT